MSFRQPSFLRRILLLISLLLIAIFVVTGYLLRENISESARDSVELEVVASFHAYQALWNASTENLQTVSRVISRMADVRAAFATNDRATIRDTSGELWSHVASGNALFTVADGTGKIIANLGEHSPFNDDETLLFIPALMPRFPSQQTGFYSEGGRLFQIVVTPVYVDSAREPQLLNVLVTGFELDGTFLAALKTALGGSDLLFKVNGKLMASTSMPAEGAIHASAACSLMGKPGEPQKSRTAGVEYMALMQPLSSLSGGGAAELCTVRSLATSQAALRSLLRRVFWWWLAGLVAAVGCTYAIVRRMLQPVSVLDRAAYEIARGNYSVRVDERRRDELGRLAASFNAMSASLESARAELIRHERLESVARLATFVVHDLRNPLASIYAGAEMLVDTDLPPKQLKRLATNMYNASRGVMAILGDLLSAAKRGSEEPEWCALAEMVMASWAGLENLRGTRDIQLMQSIPADLELMLDRGPIERVFHNLLENAVEAIADSGVISIDAEVKKNYVLLHIRDNGRGIPGDLQSTLFQPFATKGRAGGMGLGLALSRQTVLSHGGDLWADLTVTSGSHFIMKLPRP